MNILSKLKKPGQTDTPKGELTHDRKTVDTLYARQRRLEARIVALENALTSMRRDINRIEKANSRDKPPPPQTESQELLGLDSELYR